MKRVEQKVVAALTCSSTGDAQEIMRSEADCMVDSHSSLNAFIDKRDDIKKYVFIPNRRKPFWARFYGNLYFPVVIYQRLHARLLLDAEERIFHKGSVIL
ncbi:hypothetical protein SXCC_00563 [Gluconacetobacter sp. SXCC-1]|nr:hypothetical protein SXCC_00563 [Gluconacetobacter sp. SXCC-1]